MAPPAKGRGPTGTDLDDRASYQALDAGGMLDFAIDFPAQVRDAARIGRSAKTAGLLRRPAHIVLAGMGGSAVAGDFLVRLCHDHLAAPFVVCRDYRIPGFVGSRTLFIACSHSGNTEETLSAARLARRRGAAMVCISSDGKLAAFARRHHLPLIEIPQTDPPMRPRAAVGYSLIPLVCLLGSLGLYPGAVRHIRETIGLLSELRDEVHPEVPTKRNRAKQLATILFGKTPWVQGTVGIMSAAAYRWRCQFNENSKVLAYSSEYPELNHNEVVGWELSSRLSERLAVLILERPADMARIEARVSITRDLVSRKSPAYRITAQGRSPLAQLLSVVYLGDFVSLYLAFLNRVDPSSNDAINELKTHLAQL